MAFAYTAAVAGAGTVSCTGTTTVTGTGTTFATLTGAAAGANHARVGGQITVGANTRTIVKINSTTSLETDTAFPAFTAQAFTVRTGVVQTGTDTMNLNLGVITGFNVTNRADLMRTFDVRGCDLSINGVLTVDTTVAQLRNDGSCNNSFVVNGSASGGEIIFDGRKSTANNAPFPYPGFDWLGTNGLKIMYLTGTDAYPGKFRLKDACVRFGADWLTTYSIHRSIISTEGSICWFLCAKGTGTSQARIRQDNLQASINFQATKTYVGVWANFGVAQTSLAGYTPMDTDGPEINASIISVSPRIPIENYDTTYVKAAYYTGSEITLYAGAWVNLKSNLKGTNITWYSQSVGGATYNVIEFSKVITAKAQDAAGNALSGGYLYYQPTGSNVAGVRSKGATADITFDLTQQAIAFSSGSATNEFIYAWAYASTAGLKANTLTSYFCTGVTKGAETHTFYSSTYGYDKQSSLITLAGNNAATPTFVHASLPTTDKVLANAAAISGVTFNFSTKTWTVSGSLTVQQIYDAYQYQLNQTANLQQPNECTVVNSLFTWVGWSGINNGTITAGASNLQIGANTITNNGSITAIYVTSAGTSSSLQLTGVSATGVAAVWNPSTNATELFQTNNTGSTTSYTLYYPPGSAGLVKNYARELYGYQRSAGSVTLAAGVNAISFIDVQDVGITEATLATVNAYTAIETASKFYDRTEAFRRTEPGIKLGQIVTRSGTSLDIGSYSHVVNQSAAAVYAIVGSTITTKATAYAGDTKYTTEIATPPATITAATTEVITIAREDANGDSQITIQAAGVSTFEIWKITNATNPDDYATGTLVATVSIGTWRFIHADGYKFVIRDTTTNYRVVNTASKGIYTAELFFGAQVQLAQAAEVTQINTKVDIMQIDLDAVKGTGFTKDVHSLTNIKKKAALAAALSA